MFSCANCGKGEEESEHLKTCLACKEVKYCDRDCQVAHRPMHKKACKKRAAELHHDALFIKQPPKEEDCPICMIELPSLGRGKTYKVCCGKVICNGCVVAMLTREGGKGICPFCRAPPPVSEEVEIEKHKQRIELGDNKAVYNLACLYNTGVMGLPRDQNKALKLFRQAAEAGCSKAYYHIGNAYLHGIGVEYDIKKATHYWELAAIGGDVDARLYLATTEHNAHNYAKALKHYTIASAGGDPNSVTSIKEYYIKASE